MARVLLALAVLALAGVGGWSLVQAGAGDDRERGTVDVQRGDVVRVALAVGNLEPRHEVRVNSSTGGTVQRVLVRPGQKVAAGEPLAEVRPYTTSLTELQAERSLQAARDGEEAAREFLEGEHLLAHMTRLMQGRAALERMYRQAQLGRQQAEERLQLLREGKVDVGETVLDYVVRAPVTGHVLVRHVREGDPVTPASSYGSGTVLVTLADMDRPMFRGTADEIDVGSMREGMSASVSVGALPGLTLDAKVTEIGLKAERRDNSVVFPVELRVTPREDVELRAGYSAVAEIVLQERRDVLVLPERVIDFRNGQAFVQVASEDAERRIETGLSDGLTVEVTAGVEEGVTVLEPLLR